MTSKQVHLGWLTLGALLSLANCDAILKKEPAQDNCVNNAELCPAMSKTAGLDLFCNPSSKTCEPYDGSCISLTQCILPSATVCNEGACIPCSVDTHCRAWSDARNEVPQRRFCRQPDHLCVQCRAGMEATDCTDAIKPACDSTTGLCRACNKDSECASGICRKPGDYPSSSPVPGLMTGQCVPTENIAYVDNQMPPCSAAGPGTQTSPYCAVAQAITAGKAYIKVAGSPTPYPAVNESSGSLVIVGPGRDLTGASAATFDQVVVSGTASVVLSGAQVVPATVGAPATQCTGNGAGLYLLDTVISAMSGRGVDADASCGQLVVERTRVTSGKFGITIAGAGSNYRIVNTAVSHPTVGGGGAEQYAVNLGSGASGFFAYNTVTRYLNGVACSPGQGLDDSIVSGNMITQVFSCDSINRVHTGPVTFSTTNMLEPKLVDTPTNVACCIDKGQAPPEPIPTDHYGTSRPKRQGYDIGYHELE